MNTSLLIDKETHKIAGNRAKKDSLSVSAVARMLLRAYGEGKINIVATVETSHNPIEWSEVDSDELDKSTLNAAKKAYELAENELIDL
jgi:hypothetical protein